MEKRWSASTHQTDKRSSGFHYFTFKGRSWFFGFFCSCLIMLSIGSFVGLFVLVLSQESTVNVPCHPFWCSDRCRLAVIAVTVIYYLISDIFTQS